MAAVRIGQFAVHRPHLILGLQRFTAPTAQVGRCHSNQDIASRKQTMASRRALESLRRSVDEDGSPESEFAVALALALLRRAPGTGAWRVGTVPGACAVGHLRMTEKAASLQARWTATGAGRSTPGRERVGDVHLLRGDESPPSVRPMRHHQKQIATLTAAIAFMVLVVLLMPAIISIYINLS